MFSNPALRDVVVEEFDVLDEPTTVTAPNLARERSAAG
jgi:hypothetical protein